MAFAGVAPIGHKHAAVRAVEERHAAEPRVVGFEQVGPMASHVTGAAPFEQIVVDTVAMNVEREKRVAIVVRPVVTQIHHRAAMGVAAARRVILGVLRTFGLPEAARPMNVVGTALDEPERVRVHVLTVHPFVARARNHVEQVFDDAVGDEHLAVIIECDAPGIGAAVGDDLKNAARRVKPPDAAVDGHALRARRAWPADFGIGENPMTAIEPPVRSPGEAVDDVVLGFEAPAIEHDLGRTVWHVVVIAVGDENQFRSGAEPDAAEPEGNAGEIPALIEEDVFRVEPAVSIAVFQDDHAVMAGDAICLPLRIRETLDHPEAPAFVGGHRNRLNDVWFAREQRDLKTCWHGHAPGAFGGRQRRVLGFGSEASNHETDGKVSGGPGAKGQRRHRRLL